MRHRRDPEAWNEAPRMAHGLSRTLHDGMQNTARIRLATGPPETCKWLCSSSFTRAERSGPHPALERRGATLQQREASVPPVLPPPEEIHT
jgi:hypothetical protein